MEEPLAVVDSVNGKKMVRFTRECAVPITTFGFLILKDVGSDMTVNIGAVEVKKSKYNFFKRLLNNGT